MKIEISAELRGILESIVNESTSINFWRDHAASDWFQTENYCGGFESVEDGFTFSYFAPDGKEYWFQFLLSDLPEILDGTIETLEGRLPD